MKEITKVDVVKTVKVLNQGEAVVSSLDIHKIFNKEHKNVLATIYKQIENLEEMSESHGLKLSREINKYFIENSYINSRGKDVKRYNLTRRGFDLVVL